MRAIRAASAALVGAAALVLAPHVTAGATPTRPLAVPPVVTGHGDERFRAIVTPAVIPAGGRVTLTALGCRGDTTVTSTLFGTVTLQKHSGSGTATVDRSARPGGRHRVTFVCVDGRVRSRELTVSRDGTAGARADDAGGPARHGVRAGLGGALGGFDLQQIGVGLALLGGALAMAYRRARRHSEVQETPAEPGEQAGRTTG